MSWSFFQATQYFDSYATLWDELNARQFKNHPLFDSRFVGPLVEHFALENVKLAVFSRVDTVESMMLLSQGNYGKLEIFHPSQAMIYPVLGGSINGILALINQLSYRTPALELYCQDPAYISFSTQSSSLIQELVPHIVTVSINLSGCFEDYWNQRTKKLKKNIARTFRNLGKANINYQLKVTESPIEIEQALKRYGNLETKGWKGRAGTNIHSHNAQGQFYQNMLHRFSETGCAIVYELYFDNVLASSQLAICNNSMLITLKTTHDETLRSYSPGNLLDFFILQHEFQLKRFSIVEFYTNAGPELIRWATQTRQIFHLTVYRNKAIRSFARSYRSLTQKLGKD